MSEPSYCYWCEYYNQPTDNCTKGHDMTNLFCPIYKYKGDITSGD